MRLTWSAIVRNESARIERCMASLVPWISSAVIVDTGSTDNTVQKIKDYLDKHGIPSQISSVPFKNFEQARNSALHRARHSPFACDYFLLVDADMELVVTNPDWIKELRGGLAYEMKQIAGSVVYDNARLLSCKAKGLYKGVTHEYLDVPSAGRIGGAHFIDHADGANRPDKFKRDIELLEEALRKEPDFDRYWFYLANSYRDAGMFGRAADAFKKRVSMGGWDEEVWNAQFNYAHCLNSLGDTGGFLRELLVAYNLRPSRGETLYDLARHYREKGMNAASLVFSEAGLQLSFPKDSLFVDKDKHTTGFREEFSICAYYDPAKRARGFEVCDGLSLDPQAPEWTRAMAANNLFWYVRPLQEHVGHIVHHRIPFTPPDGYTPLNPSVVVDGEHIIVLVRTVNYVITDDGHYMINGKDGRIHYDDSNPIHTRNFIVRLTAAWALQDAAELLPPTDMPEPKFGLVRGFEDMRLFKIIDKFWTSSTVREMNAEGWCEQVLASFEVRWPGSSYEITDVRRMLPEDRHHEKNWMPMVRGAALRFVYRLGTLIDMHGQITDVHPPKYATGGISGGSQAIPLPGTEQYLAIVHEARYRPDNNQRYYTHRFAWMKENGELLGLTKPFVLRDKQIEFAAGLAIHPDQKRLIISYGVRDCEAWVSTVDILDVMGMFV